jgi:hypothetical protein
MSCSLGNSRTALLSLRPDRDTPPRDHPAAFTGRLRYEHAIRDTKLLQIVGERQVGHGSESTRRSTALKNRAFNVFVAARRQHPVDRDLKPRSFPKCSVRRHIIEPKKSPLPSTSVISPQVSSSSNSVLKLRLASSHHSQAIEVLPDAGRKCRAHHHICQRLICLDSAAKRKLIFN